MGKKKLCGAGRTIRQELKYVLAITQWSVPALSRSSSLRQTHLPDCWPSFVLNAHIHKRWGHGDEVQECKGEWKEEAPYNSELSPGEVDKRCRVKGRKKKYGDEADEERKEEEMERGRKEKGKRNLREKRKGDKNEREYSGGWWALFAKPASRLLKLVHPHYLPRQEEIGEIGDGNVRNRKK